MKNLAEGCAEYHCKLVACSSDQVYFRRKLPEETREHFLIPHREEESLSPVCIYGKHKAKAENIGRKICEDAVFLRLSWLYAPLTKKEITAGRQNLLTKLYDQIKENKQACWSFEDYRGVTDVNAVIHNLEAAFALPGGCYNFGSSAQYSIGNEIQNVFRYFHKEELILPSEKTQMRNLNMDLKKVGQHGIVFPNMSQSLTEQLEKLQKAEE